MNISSKLTSLIIFSFVLYSKSFAQQNASDSLKLSCTVKEFKNKNNLRKILLGYTMDDGFSRPNIGTQYIIENKLDSTNNITFNLPNLNKPYKITLVIRDKDKNRLYFEKFYTEPNDNIKMEVVVDNNRTFANFNGDGKEKYILIQKLQNEYDNDFSSEFQLIGIHTKGSIKNLTDLNIKMEKLAQLIRKYDRKKAELIKSADISQSMKIIVNLEYADYKNKWRFYSQTLGEEYALYRRQIRLNYLKHNEEFSYKLDSLSAFCPDHMLYSLLKIAYESTNDNSNSVNLNLFYNRIKSINQERTRDRLLGEFILNRTLQNRMDKLDDVTRDSLYKDAYSIVKVSVIKKIIKDKIEFLIRTTSSPKIINSKFVKLNGDSLELNSMLGKVVLIDTWYLGCSFCAYFHNVFEKEIYPLFKDRKNFIVLSINISKKREDWIKGIATNKYTSEDYVNVSTGVGVGLNHPFMKYYGVNGAPYLMLIDASGNVSYFLGGVSSDKMIEKITNALNSFAN